MTSAIEYRQSISELTTQHKPKLVAMSLNKALTLLENNEVKSAKMIND
jgi:hypothetical protein